MNAQPETLACPDCEGTLFVIMYGGALPRPKVKCAGCGACWFIGSGTRGTAGRRHEYVAPFETGEPWRGPAQGDWDESRGG